MIGDYNVTLRFWFGGKFKEVGDAIYYGGEWIGLLMQTLMIFHRIMSWDWLKNLEADDPSPNWSKFWFYSAVFVLSIARSEIMLFVF